MKKAILALADGKIFEGRSFGFEGNSGGVSACGEVVFNTSITGYQEILTDPSYFGQIVLLTYPMIGNTGVNGEDGESLRPQAAGLLVKEYCENFSNWRATQSLAQYLKKNKMVAAQGLPTREIVRHIREKGAMPGVLAVGDVDVEAVLKQAQGLNGMAGQNLVDRVTCAGPYVVEPAGGREKFFVIACDFGIKRNMIRELIVRGCRVKVVPAKTSAKEILDENPDGILLSNGPGDPAACGELVENISPLVGRKPILGICLGHQLLALALGAKTFKLKFGHRGANQPVKDLATGRVLITSQNHGFAVDPNYFPKNLEITQWNLNDQTVEAFRHKKFPILSMQYHPEASPGPHDAKNIFEEFLKSLRAERSNPHA